MNTDTAGLHDPQSVDRRFLRDRMNDLLNESLHPCQGGMWMTQYDETRGMLRRKIQELGEVQIYGDQAPLFSLAGCGDRVILSTLQIFIEDRAHGVPGPDERRLPAGITILVELELHCQVVTSTGSTRSRAISAAYARQARTSSRVRLG